MWRKHPMARLLIPYLIGLLLTDAGVWIPAPFAWPCLFVLSFCLLALSWLRGHRFYQRFYGPVLMVWLCLMGGFQYQQAVRLPADTGAICNSGYTVGFGLVTGRDERQGKGPRLMVDVAAVGLDTSQLSAFRQKVLVYAADTSSVLPGDYILFSGCFTYLPPPDNPSAFNYGRYMRYQGVQLRHFARDIRVLPRQSLRSRTLQRIHILRRGCRERLLGGIPEHTNRSVLLALILGDKSDLDGDLRSAFASAGAMHVLAVSGLHVGIVGLFAGMIFGWLPIGRYRKMVRTLASLLCIWLFTILTGAGASVQRSAMMFTVVLLGQLSGGRSRIWNSLAVAAFLLLWWQPLLLFQLGFQLSFLAVAGIVFFHPLLEKCWYPGHPLLNYVWSLFCVGCGAQLTTMPLTVFYFGQFPLLFWLSGWVAIPLATLLLGSGLLKIVLASIPLADKVLATLLQWLTTLLNESMIRLSSWSFATLDGLVLSPLAAWILYAALFVIMAAYRWQPHWRRWSGWPLLLACVLVINDQYLRDHQRAWYVLIAGDAPVFEIVRGDEALRFRAGPVDSLAIHYADRGIHQQFGIRRIRERPWPRASTFVIRGKEYCLGVVGGMYPEQEVWQSCSAWLIQTNNSLPEWLNTKEIQGKTIVLGPDSKGQEEWPAPGPSGIIWPLSEKGGLRLTKTRDHE